MPVNKRKKDVKQRGSHTHGWGSKKKHRGSGNRGGKGMAGTGKRADTKKPSIWKTDYFGKHGFVHRRTTRINAVNVEYLDQHIEKLAVLNLAKREGNCYVINIADLGFDKLLGKGKVAKKLVITASSASPRAVESVKAAGGDVITPAKKVEGA